MMSYRLTCPANDQHETLVLLVTIRDDTPPSAKCPICGEQLDREVLS